MAEDLTQVIADIQKLISYLERTKSQLSETSKQATNLAQAIGKAAQIIETGDISAGVSQQITKLLNAIEKGTGERLRFLGQQIRTTLVSSINQAAEETNQRTINIIRSVDEELARTRSTYTGGPRTSPDKESEKSRLAREKAEIAKEKADQKKYEERQKAIYATEDASKEVSKAFTKAGNDISAAFVNARNQAEALKQSVIELEQQNVAKAYLSQQEEFDKLQRTTQPTKQDYAVQARLEAEAAVFNQRQQWNMALEETTAKNLETETKFNQLLQQEIEKRQAIADAALKALQTSKTATTEEQSRLQTKYPQAFAKAAELGFTPDQTAYQVKATKELTTGISRLSFQYRDLDGMTNQLNVTMSKQGTILNDTQKRYRTLGDAIIRDITEVAKWTIAVTVVYGPLRKLQELIQLTIKNEVELANIGVVLGQSQRDLQGVFNAAAQAAAATGESIDGVLEGYTQAYRATGRYEDQTKRAAAAQKLLVDSLILSKLSSLDQATAMDTLVGDLNQLGYGLDRGRELLDKWIAVSRAANVDVGTLATTFAITGASATSAGVSVDLLNGIVASLAESTKLSGEETGNSIRTMLAGFQTDRAAIELRKFGIAVTDVNGNLRDTPSLLFQIKKLFDEGLISEQQLNAISIAVGGGARTGPKLTTIFESLDKAQQLAKVSADAHGESEQALAIQLDTVQTKITNLGNSFQKLAQDMGSEGGLLSAFKLVLEVVNDIISALSVVTKSLGPGAPLFATLGTAALYLSKNNMLNPTSQTPGLYGGIGNFVEQQVTVSPILRALLGGGRNQISTAGQVATGIQEDTIGTRVTNGLIKNGPQIGTVIGVGMMTAIQAAQGNWAAVGGSLGGAAVGALLTGGNPIGTLIGSIAGQTILDNLINNKPKFQDFFAEIFKKPGTTASSGKTQAEITQENLTREIITKFGGGSETRGTFTANLLSILSNIAGTGGSFLGLNKPYQVNAAQSALAFGAQSGTFSQQEVQDYIRRLQEANKPVTQQGTFGEQAAKTQAQQYANIQGLIAEQIDKLRVSFDKGEISAKQYNDQLDALKAGPAAIVQVYTALSDTFDSTAEGIDRVTRALFNASSEQSDYIVQLTNNIADLQTKIDSLQKGTYEGDLGGLTNQQAIDQAKQQANILKQQLVLALQDVDISTALKVKLPPFQDLSGWKPQDLQKVFNEANRLQEQYLKNSSEFMKLSPEQQQAVIDSIQPIFAYISGNFEQFKGFLPGIFEQAQANLKPLGIAPQKPIESPGFQTFDVSSAQLTNLIGGAQYQSLLSKLEAGGYKPDVQTQIAILNDGVVKPFTADWKIVQYLLQEILNTEKKQLDGLYNLPSGASFYVPAQTLQYAYNAGLNAAGGGGGGKFPDVTAPGQKITGPPINTQGLFQWTPEAKKAFDELPQNVGAGVKQAIPADAFQWTDKAKKAFDDIPKLVQGIPHDTRQTQPQTLEQKLDALFSDLANTLRTFPLDILRMLGIGNNPTALGNLGAPNVNISNNAATLGQLNAAKPDLSTNLKLALNSNVNLIVDGRVLANIVKVYLYEDLLKAQGEGGSITRTLTV